MPKNRKIILSIASVILAGGLYGVFLVFKHNNEMNLSKNSHSHNHEATKNDFDPRGIALSQAGLGSVTEDLTNQNGEIVRIADAVGVPTAVFFGFTNCPEICPVTMDNLSKWMQQTDNEPYPMRSYMITVDPKRDVPEVLADFSRYFDSRIVSVTGSTDIIKLLEKKFGAHSMQITLDDGNYDVIHTSSIYLFDKNGIFQQTIGWKEDEQEAIKKIRKIRN